MRRAEQFGAEQQGRGDHRDRHDGCERVGIRSQHEIADWRSSLDADGGGGRQLGVEIESKIQIAEFVAHGFTRGDNRLD